MQLYHSSTDKLHGLLLRARPNQVDKGVKKALIEIERACAT